jgi:hypothetical protein
MPSKDCSGIRRKRGWVMRTFAPWGVMELAQRLRPHRRQANVVAASAVVVAALFLGEATAPAAAPSTDGRFVAVTSEAPAFGGMFVDGENLNVYLTDRSHTARADARSAIREAFDGQGLPRKLHVLPARFDFTRLKAWHERLSADVLRLSGVILTDIDDRKNRLTVGVENQKARGRVELRLPALRIPRYAVSIEVMAPIELQSSLWTRHRPLVGGLQLRYRDRISRTFPICTVGFSAIRGGESGFVTASHCSTNHSSSDTGCNASPHIGCTFPSDRTRYFQPSRPSSVGVEAFDPRFFWGPVTGPGDIDGCPPGNSCRYSDATFVAGAVNATRGRIARSALGGPTWNGVDRYRIVAKADPVVGGFVVMVGRTTGRTTGKVTRTCFNTNTTPTLGGFNVLCQAQAGYSSAPGDSGAPVFTLLRVGGRNVKLRGINWASNFLGGGVFSPISGVERSTELGPLTVCATGFAC